MGCAACKNSANIIIAVIVRINGYVSSPWTIALSALFTMSTTITVNLFQYRIKESF